MTSTEPVPVAKKRQGETAEEKAERKRLRKLEKKRQQAEVSEEKGNDEEISFVKKEKKEKKEKREKKVKKDKRQGEVTTAAVEAIIKTAKKAKKEKERKVETVEEDDDAMEDVETSEMPVATVVNTANSDEIAAFLKESDITISDPSESGIQPVLSFNDLVVDERMLKFLKKYPKPTPIQSASWPFLLAGKDLIGVAETGSGKTMAFAVPAVAYLLSTNKIQKSKSKGTSSISVLMVSPTRELAVQIHDNLEGLGAAVGLKSVVVYGGVSKDDQKKQLQGANIVVATPGRLMDLVNDGAIDLGSISYLVLDEADRMLEKGFEQDIKTIMRATDASKRKTIMFTATWPPSVRELASQFLNNPVKVMIGDRESELKANSRIEQVVEVMEPEQKEQRLLQLLKQYQSGAHKDDRILVFALYKKEAARVERLLQNRGFRIAAIHGDLSQMQRTNALENFKNGSCPLLLATDVAARGLDIPAVKLVINLTFPLTAEDYVHRIGRTGRAGQPGKAITFFTSHEKHLSGALINVLRSADQPVPEELLKFGGHTKKKEHSVYGAFYKEVDPTKKAKKIVFD